MSIHSDILAWSKTRPIWQQDALRRLAQNPSLNSADLDELVALCKAEHGLKVEYVVKGVPLSEVMAGGEPLKEGTPAVRLIAVQNLRNVNALHDDQSLTIADAGLTVVYGENATGKSGYVRVLKQLCRTRGGRDEVHRNVYEEDEEPASGVLQFEIGKEAREITWTPGAGGPPELGQVSVFDSRSASVYITEQNDVAYLPHGMDLFPRLVRAVEQVKLRLETEMAQLDRERDRFETIPTGTRVAEVLGALHVADAMKRVEALAAVVDTDRERLEQLRSEGQRIRSENPAGRARELRRSAERIRLAQRDLEELEVALADLALAGVQATRDALATAGEAAELAAKMAFTDAPLQGIGGDTWRALWEAARTFARQDATPSQPFPPNAEGSDVRCVLCQQILAPEATERLRQFEVFVRGETQAAVGRAMAELERRIATLRALNPTSIADSALLHEVAEFDPELAAVLPECSAILEARRMVGLSASPVGAGAVTPAIRMDGRAGLACLGQRIEKQAAIFEATATQSDLQEIEAAVGELEARVALAALRPRIAKQIEREQSRLALRKCIQSASTAAITKRNTELLGQAVTAPLAEEFSRQLEALKLTHIPITVSPGHGQKGRAYHVLALAEKPTRAVRADEVLSDGEHRCVALAAFFAEVSLQDSTSTLVFDDPVSSLDHGRRRYVAQRIAAIASTRPVLVFTHDLVFLWFLDGAAETSGVPISPRYFRRDASGAGLVADEWPWDGQKVPARVGAMKQDLVQLRKLSLTDRAAYERGVREFYGKLRETWERAVEEVLFNGALKRFDREVQTLRLRNLHRITERQMQEFEAGMTKTSEWIRGHDRVPDLALPTPDPAELEADLSAIERWVSEVRKQHNE